MSRSNVLPVELPIRTGRLTIDRFGPEHLTDRYVSWLNDPEVVRFSEQRFQQHTLESCRDYMRSFNGTPNLFLALVADGSGHIGNMTVYVDVYNVADMGSLVCRSAQGWGYGSEAWAGVCRALFKAGARKVTAGIPEANGAALGMMRNSGMVKDGRRVRHVVIDGAEIDVICWAMFRES